MSALYCSSWFPGPDNRKKRQKAQSVPNERGVEAGEEGEEYTYFPQYVTVPVTDVGNGGDHTHLLYNITVPMAGCQVQGCVIPTVHHIDSCPPHDQHLNHSRAALSASPVQGGEAMIVPLKEEAMVIYLEVECGQWPHIVPLCTHPEQPYLSRTLILIHVSSSQSCPIQTSP